jgi:hypothetical protein
MCVYVGPLRPKSGPARKTIPTRTTQTNKLLTSCVEAGTDDDDDADADADDDAEAIGAGLVERSAPEIIRVVPAIAAAAVAASC